MKLRKIKMNKKGGYTDIFLFMIVAIIIVIIAVVFIYMASQIRGKLHEEMDNMTESDSVVNYSETIDDTFGKTETAYHSLYWIAVFLILGMIIAIFIGSYMVTTKPVYFVPYIFMVIIAVVVSVGISNAYEQIRADSTLASTFEGMVGSNFILANLPIWIAIIGIGGGIIMFVKMQHGEEELYYG